MANTNRPTQNTHQQITVPPNGSAVFGPDGPRLRYYNNYPVVQKQIGQDPQYYVKRRPAVSQLSYLMNVTSQRSVTASWYDTYLNRMWFVNGRDLIYVDPFTPVTAGHFTNQLQANPTISHIEQFKVADKNYIAILDTAQSGNSKIHYFDLDFGTFVATADLPIRTNRIVFMDGYLFMASAIASKQRIYNTTLGNELEVLENASFIDAEMNGDPIVTLAAHHNHLVAFGRDTIEFFHNAANEVGSPLTRQGAYAQHVGLYDNGIPSVTAEAPAWAMVEIKDVIYFVGTSRNKNIEGLYKLENFKASKVSDNAFDLILRNFRYPKLLPFDLDGETCVLVADATEILSPYVFIPSKGIAVQFAFGFVPIHSEIISSGFDHSTILWRSGLTSPMYCSGPRQWPFGASHTETFTSQYLVDYVDFNNNAIKHFKYVDVLGAFQDNLVAIGFRNDNFGFDSTKFVNMPYVSASTVPSDGAIRFRNMGRARRQGYTVFVNGPSDYIYKGVTIGYNQWGE